MRGLPWRRSQQPVRLVLADDHAVVRQALGILLAGAGFEVVGEASNGEEAVVLVRERAPDVAVLDVVMPLLDGLEAARQILRTCPRTRVVLLTSRHDERLIFEAVQAGVQGYVQKAHEAKELIRAIREVAAGGAHLGAAAGPRGGPTDGGGTPVGSALFGATGPEPSFRESPIRHSIGPRWRR